MPFRLVANYRVIVGADKTDDKETELLSFDIAKRFRMKMTYRDR